MCVSYKNVLFFARLFVAVANYKIAVVFGNLFTFILSYIREEKYAK